MGIGDVGLVVLVVVGEVGWIVVDKSFVSFYFELEMLVLGGGVGGVCGVIVYWVFEVG